MNDYELYLEHHGILGQKWGVRRFQNRDGTLTNAGKSRNSQDETHSDYEKAHSKKSVSSMSDAELRTRLNRLNMEQQYSRVSKTKISSGKKYVDGIIKAGTTIATITTTALTIYNNLDKINKIVAKS